MKDKTSRANDTHNIKKLLIAMSKYNFDVLFMVLILLFVACDNLVNSKNDDSYNSNTEITDNKKISTGQYSYLTDNGETTN